MSTNPPKTIILPVLRHQRVLTIGHNNPWIAGDFSSITGLNSRDLHPNEALHALSLDDRVNNDESGAKVCKACSSITLDRLLEDGAQGAEQSHFIIDWPAPHSSRKHCPLCRLIFDYQSWTQGWGESPGRAEFDEFLQQSLSLRVGLNQPATDLEFTIAQWVDELPFKNGSCAISATHGSYASAAISGRPFLSNSTDDTFFTIRRWLEDCDSTHISCQEKLLSTEANCESSLPTRVIDVGPSDKPSNVRLVETGGMSGRYTALSHCWGAGLEAQTTKLSLSTHCESIDLNHLSATLRDAIKVTQMLGIQYIWIDSLCIIQDDPEDWRREASVMGVIYDGAYCTIAATTAKDGNTGFLSPLMTSAKDSVVSLPCDKSSLTKGSIFFGLSRPLVTCFAMDVAPLNRRAWVLQERVLSRRILHFTTNGMLYWECDKVFTAADGREVLSFNDRPRLNILRLKDYKLPHEVLEDDQQLQSPLDRLQESFSSTRWIWEDLVSAKYSTCGLTRLSDKLPALIGLAQAIQAQTSALYSSGMWFGIGHKWCHIELLWMPRGESLVRASEPRAPSWSWACLEGGIQFWDTARVIPGHADATAVAKSYTGRIKEIVPSQPSNPSSFDSLLFEGNLKHVVCVPDERYFPRESALIEAETIFIPLIGFPREFDANERSFPICKDIQNWDKLDDDVMTRRYQGWVCFDCDDSMPQTFFCLPLFQTIHCFDERDVFGGHRDNTNPEEITDLPNDEQNIGEEQKVDQATLDDPIREGEYTVWRILALALIPDAAHTESATEDSHTGFEGRQYSRVGYGEIYGSKAFDLCSAKSFYLV